MNSYANVLIQMIIFILLSYFIFISCYKALVLPKQKHISTYVDIKTIIKYGIVTSAKLIVTLLITGIIFYAFKETQLKISTQQNSNDILIFLIFITFALIISTLTINSIKSIYRFLYKLIIYISLRKNTVSNNLRHAIANKNHSDIIKYYKLMKQADEKIVLSIDEILTLMASLSHAGYNVDVKEILTPKLRQKQSIFQRYMKNNSVMPKMAEYEVGGIDSTIDKSESFKHKLSIFEEKSKKISIIIAFVSIIQLIIIILSSMGLVSNMFKSFVLMVVSIFVIYTVVIKYRKLQKIYKSEFNKEKISLKIALLDKLQLGLSLFIFIIGIASLVFI